MYVSFDPRVLTASGTSIDFNGNVLQSVTSSIITQSECISGQAAPGGACTNGGLDGPGVVNLGIVFQGNFSTPNNTNGLLYHLALTVNAPVSGQIDPGATQIHLVKVELSPANTTLGAIPSITSDAFFTNRYCSGAILCSPPHAEFTYSPSTVAIGTNVLFNASASFATNPGSRISSYQWSWDGEICRATSSLQIEQVPAVTHQFCNARDYSVSLTVNDTYGITWTSAQDISVLYLWIDVYIRQFSISPQFNVVVGTPVSMTTVVGNNSTISENASLTISVENRTLATIRFANLPPLSDASPQQTIWNTTGLLAGTYTLEASLGPVPEANLTIATTRTANVYLVSTFDKPPTADFTFSPTSPVAGEQLMFDGSASSDPDGTVQSWTWSFGDGDTVFDGPVFDHEYNEPGNYTVTLTVTDNAGLTGSKSVILTVLPQPAHDVGVIQTYVSPIITAASLAAVTGLVGVAWKKGYLRRRDEPGQFFH